MSLPAFGIHPGVCFGAYQSWDAANHSMLKHFSRSAAHAKHEMSQPKTTTAAQRLGNALHVATFEPGRFADEFVTLPDFGNLRETINKERFVAAIEDIIGKSIPNGVKIKKDDLLTMAQEQGVKTVLEASEFDDVKGMGQAINDCFDAQFYVNSPGHCEVSCLWKDARSGIVCKGRFDKLATIRDRRIIVELKSTKDAREFPFGKDVANLFYHAQAAGYIEGHAAATGEKSEHVIIAVENSAPYCVAVWTLSDDALAVGLSHRQSWLNKYADCLATGDWPGYKAGVNVLDIPKYTKHIEE